jgi:hypothetical protein
MLKAIGVICICLTSFALFAQEAAKYEVATITDVQVHQDNGSAVVRYDVSVKVGGTIYLVLYTPPLGVDTVKYAAGRELLVLVDKENITYNDILGESYQVPIVSQRPAAGWPK